MSAEIATGGTVEEIPQKVSEGSLGDSEGMLERTPRDSPERIFRRNVM